MCEAELLNACYNMRREEVWAVCEMGEVRRNKTIEERRIM